MIEKLTSYIQPIVVAYGAGGVFLGTLLEEIIAPIPSPLIPLMAGFLLLPTDKALIEIIGKAGVIIALPVSLGITLGSLVVYSLGYIGGKPAIDRCKKLVGLTWKDVEKIEKKIVRGSGDEVALFILRALPVIPGVAISAFCGILRYPLKTFMTVTLLGSFTRAFLLGITGWYVGGLYSIYSEALSKVEKYILFALIISTPFFIGWLYFQRRKRKKAE